MSRAYRIRVHAKSRQVVRASDHVCAQLELLEILPPERMADLLAAELKKRGFARSGTTLQRRQPGGIVIEIDPVEATVTVRAEVEKMVTIEGEAQGWSAAADGKENDHDREALRQQLVKDLDRQANQKRGELQKKVTEKLEGELADLRKELDQAVNRVTADALKEKAARLGHIKQMTEDAATGSLTIVLEV